MYIKIYNQNINMLPDSVETISLSYNFEVKIENVPKNLKEIKLFVLYPYLRYLEKLRDAKKLDFKIVTMREW